MVYDLQKANMWKRISAWLCDTILVAVLAVGVGFALSGLLGYDSYNERMDRIYADYSAQYGVSFDITQDDYLSMSEAERQTYDSAIAALNADDEALDTYNRIVQLTLVMTTLGILVAMLIWEFFIPLWLGNGQTLGKKVFGLCLMRTDGVKVSNFQLFTRAVLGKFAIETMIPVYIVLMIFWGTMGLVGPVVLLGLLIAQCASVIATRTNSALHDLAAGTVVVDSAAQMIFPTAEALIEHQKKVAAERAARQTY